MSLVVFKYVIIIELREIIVLAVYTEFVEDDRKREAGEGFEMTGYYLSFVCLSGFKHRIVGSRTAAVSWIFIRKKMKVECHKTYKAKKLIKRMASASRLLVSDFFFFFMLGFRHV